MISSEDQELAASIQREFSGPSFRLYTNDDPAGVEIGAALKNTIAIGAGICQGLGLGNNSIAALITRGLAEITRINDNRVMMQPRGRFLVATNRDRRGVIRDMSTLLAENDINIANIELSRDRPYGRALMLVQTDEAVPSELIDELLARGVLETVRAVVLGA